MIRDNSPECKKSLTARQVVNENIGKYFMQNIKESLEINYIFLKFYF